MNPILKAHKHPGRPPFQPCKRSLPSSIGLALVLTLLFTGAAHAAQGRRITLAWSARSGVMAPIWVAQEAGIYKKYGLDDQLVFIESGSLAAAALMGKSADVAFVAGSSPVLAAAEGTDIVMFFSVFRGLPFQFYVESTFKTDQDLRGKKIAVARFGSISDFATRLALREMGIGPKEVNLLQVGSTGARAAALEAGAVYGTLASPPANLVLKKLGYRMIYNLMTSKVPFQFTGATALRSRINQDPDLFARVVKALSDAIYVFKTQKELSQTVMAKYLRLRDRGAIEEGYEFYSKNMPEIPYVDPEGFRTIIHDLAKQNPKVQAVDPARIVDNRFVNELEKKGFFRALYKR